MGDPALFNELLIEVVQAVDGDPDSPDRLFGALEYMKDFFNFGSTFVYESDPMRNFILHEHSSTFEHDALLKSFMLEQLLTTEQIARIAINPWCCAQQDFSNNDILDALCAFFNNQSLFVAFIVDDDNTVVGCVGMADKREHDPLTEGEFFQAQTLLKLITEHSRFRIYKRRLEYTSATLKNIIDHTGFDIYVNDFYTHEMLYANETMAEPYGGWENMRGKTCHEALYDGQDFECEYCPKKEIIDEDGNPTKIYSWDYQRPFDERWFRVMSVAFEWTDGRLAQVISSADIDEAKRNELLIQHMAYFDQLTGIGNRRKLEHDLKELLEKPEALENGISIIFLDLDGFKTVNDTYGHNGGDALLKHISKLFLESPLTENRCYRYGGDEFIFLFENVSKEEATTKGRGITELLEVPIEIEGAPVSCAGSFGVAHYPEDGKDYWTLLDRADDAMYDEKKTRKAQAKR